MFFIDGYACFYEVNYYENINMPFSEISNIEEVEALSLIGED